MKLANLFLITALVGVLSAIGCSEDTNGTAGTGGDGTGGTAGSGTAGTGGATDPCTGGLCDAPEPNEAKAFCIVIIDECNDTVEIDPPPTQEECDVLGNAAACTEGAGGAGGGGGAGGAGGDLGCDVLACMTDDALKARCEEAVEKCFIYCATDDPNECQEDECLGLGLLICNLTGE